MEKVTEEKAEYYLGSKVQIHGHEVQANTKEQIREILDNRARVAAESIFNCLIGDVMTGQIQFKDES